MKRRTKAKSYFESYLPSHTVSPIAVPHCTAPAQCITVRHSKYNTKTIKLAHLQLIKFLTVITTGPPSYDITFRIHCTVVAEQYPHFVHNLGLISTMEAENVYKCSDCSVHQSLRTVWLYIYSMYTYIFPWVML